MMLKDSVILITGGSRGIGSEIAKAAAVQGAEVIFTYRHNKDEATALVEHITEGGGRARACQMDVTERASVSAVMKVIDADHGVLHGLVNNAGINIPTDFDKITDADFDAIIAVNLKGPFIVTQEALPCLRRAKGASIVNIGSVSGQYGGPRTAHYAASKAGLISLGQVIARFGGKDGIRCNTLAVGLVASDMAAAGLANPAVQKASESILLGRLGTKEEVAQAAVFLLSTHSSYMTAATVNLNGGLYF
jgi:3-oxoacyl-[acyl-carrier protein] reductase